MATLSELLAQKAAIEKQIADTQREERGTAIAKIKSLMSEYGLSLADLGTRAMPMVASSTSKKVAAKYRNAATGDTWSGRGLKPNWLKAALATGRSLTEFSV